MNLKKLGLALAVSAAATSANAALYDTQDDAGNTTGSSLLFAAYDSTAASTMYVDLTERLHTFDLNGNLNIDLSSAAAAEGFNLSNVQWTIVAGDQVAGGGTCGTSNLSACGSSYMATVSTGAAVPASDSSANQFAAISGVHNNWFLNVNGGINASATNSTTIADGNFGSWTTGITQADRLWNTSGTTGETLGFAVAATTGEAAGRGWGETDTAIVTQAAGSWTLDANGGLSYGSAVAAVPVPAAVWMFASGLMGMAGVARRRKQA